MIWFTHKLKQKEKEENDTISYFHVFLLCKVESNFLFVFLFEKEHLNKNTLFSPSYKYCQLVYILAKQTIEYKKLLIDDTPNNS